MSERSMSATADAKGKEPASQVGSVDWWKLRLTEIVDGDAAFQKAMREEVRSAGDNTPDFSGSYSC